MSKIMHSLYKRILAVLLAAVLVFSMMPEVLSVVDESDSTEIGCHIRYSHPAICCDVGQTIDLTACAVQFSADTGMVTNSIVWTWNGTSVATFTPSQRGVTELVAKSGSKSRIIYVVAKNPEEQDYVLYRNDFNRSPDGFRTPECTTGAYVYTSEGNLVLDASSNDSSYIRVLLPEYLDVFGDATIKASMKITSPVNSKKWASLMYRVQGGNYPYYQACFRSDASLYNGVEISQKNSSYDWEVYRNSPFFYSNASDYNLYSVTANGTHSVVHINGREITDFGNTAYANGGFGIQTRGTKLLVDFVEITLDGNATSTTSQDVSFAKPAIRADMGQTIDLTACDVQFSANVLYTAAENIVWRQNGRVITSFTPSAAGVMVLTATASGITKKIYVVTRNLWEGEYVLYRNDFNSAPTDFRVIETTGSAVYHNGSGQYVLDAAGNKDAYARVLLPSFLDEFGDFKLETRYQESNVIDGRKWASLMAHVQNQDRPYIQFCIRNDASVADGVDISHRQNNTSVQWDVYAKGSSADKVAGEYNTYALTVQGNHVSGSINGNTVISCIEHPYVTGAMGMQARGMRVAFDYVKVTLGENTAQQDSAVECVVSKSRPAIGCNIGQTVLLDQCSVQFTYGAYPVDGSQIIWKKDGKVITEFSDTTFGMHQLTATHGHTTMNVYIVAKKSTAGEYELYSNDFTNGPTDYRVPETSNGGSVYPINGTFVLNASGNADSYVRVLLPAYLDEFGDANFEASIKLSSPTDISKWGSVMYRIQNSNVPYLQCCYRYNSAASSGVEITQRTPDGTWNVLQSGTTTAHSAGGFNVIRVQTESVNTSFSINGTPVLTATNTPYYNGSWGFQVRGLTMTIDYVRLSFRSNTTEASLYTIPGGYVDVRQPNTGISVAPSLITDVKTRSDFDNILSNCPAVAIMNYDVIDGVAKIVFEDGMVTPDEALDKLGAKVIPAFRIQDNEDADSLASFLRGRNQRDAYAVSTTLSVVKRAYDNWWYIRGVMDYSQSTDFDPESIRYDALGNSARVLILPESTSKATITKLQDSYSCVWLTISEGKTASVAATNKGPYGLITPDRALTEYCYQTYYAENTLIRHTNVIGHRGNPSLAPENTILSTQTAYNNGANMVETDIYLTLDKVVYVMHDEKIDRTTNGTGNILEMTSAQVSKYKVDYFSGVSPQAIPTLEDQFKLIKGNPDQKLVIEMKHPADSSLANALAQLIRKYDILDQVVVISFIQNNLVYLKQQLPGAPVGWLNWLNLDETNPVYSVYEALENIQPYNTVCNPGYNGFGSAVIEELAHRGVTLWPWTLNNQTQFDQLMMAGVAGITTDYSQWSKDYIESLHWNSGSRVISTTYKGVLTDVTNSVEVVVVEDTLGISCSAGNITVPEKKEGGKASFYYRLRSVTPTGLTYYTVTEIRTIEVASAYTFELKDNSELSLDGAYLTKVTDQYTVAEVKNQFKYPVAVLDADGALLEDAEQVSTGDVVYLIADPTKRATVILEGDVNGDGRVDSTDYLWIKNCFLGKEELAGIYYEAADCNNDGLISATDYLRIKAYFLEQFDLYG